MRNLKNNLIGLPAVFLTYVGACAALALTTSGCQFGSAQMATASGDAQFVAPQVTAADRSLLSDVPNALDYARNGIVPEQISQFADAGPGIIVCSPVVAGGDAGLSNFAEGCGAWLQLEVGGQPEFGRTPSWRGPVRAAWELTQPGLHLNVQQAEKLMQICGATHAAVATLSAAGAGQYRLSYSIIDTADGKPIGAEIDATGTRDQIVQQLPSLGNSIAKQLGSKRPLISSSAASTADEMALLGRCYWEGYSPSDAEMSQLSALAHRAGNGLAAMINVDDAIC